MAFDLTARADASRLKSAFRFPYLFGGAVFPLEVRLDGLVPLGLRDVDLVDEVLSGLPAADEVARAGAVVLAALPPRATDDAGRLHGGRGQGMEVWNAEKFRRVRLIQAFEGFTYGF